MKKILLLAAFLALPLYAAQAQGLSKQQQDEVQAIVEKTLKEKPEAIINSLRSYQEQEQSRVAAEQGKKVRDALPKILERKDLTVLGNPKGDVTVVEFFDYNCGFCKRMLPVLQDVLKTDKNVRWVLVDLPILSESSGLAAKAALAAEKQGKFLSLHVALLDNKGQLDEAKILEYAKAAKIDTDRLKKDMADAAIDKTLQDNRALAASLGINGTPAFIIGDQLNPGALSLDAFKSMIEAARKAGNKKQ